MFSVSLEKHSVGCDVLDQSSFDSIENFINTIFGIEITGISAELKNNIKQIAHEIIPWYISLIDEKFGDLQLCNVAKANKLKLDREKLIMFQVRLKIYFKLI